MNAPAPRLLESARLPDPEIFPQADYEHRLRLGRCPPEAFFQPWKLDPPGDLLAERRHWITTAPERHALADPSALEALVELAECATHWTGHPFPSPATLDAPSLTSALGAVLEPDFILLSREAIPPRMIAASVCFPSSWAPEEKLGTTLDRIHDVVPELNASLGNAIGGFLGRLKPGTAWIRANWGLSASPERNQHPARLLPRLLPPLDPAGTWVRIEHQALLALPRSGAILFGLRIERRPLSRIAGDPSIASSLARTIRSMPESMAAYKGIAGIRSAVVNYLLHAASHDTV